jgi:hypothetical protein
LVLRESLRNPYLALTADLNEDVGQNNYERAKTK